MKRTRLLLVVVGLAATLGFAGLRSAETAAAPAPLTKIEHVDAAGAVRLLTNTNIVVLDIRTPDEFKDGHLKGAKLVDFRATDFAAKLGELDRNKTYLVHCASGRRSTNSLETFKKLGFKSVVHLDGGFNGWKAAGKPVEK